MLKRLVAFVIYFGVVFAWAAKSWWKRSKIILGTGVLMGVMYLFIGWFVHSRMISWWPQLKSLMGEPMNGVLIQLVYVILAAGCIGLIAFIVFAVAAPSQIYHEQKLAIDDLSQAKDAMSRDLEQFEPIHWARGLPTRDKARRREQWDAAVSGMIDWLQATSDSRTEVQDCIGKIARRLKNLLTFGDDEAKRCLSFLSDWDSLPRVSAQQARSTKEEVLAYLGDLRGRISQDQLRLPGT